MPPVSPGYSLAADKSDFLIRVKPQKHSKVTADRIIEIVRDQGKWPETDSLLGSKRRVSAKTFKPLLIIRFAGELVL